MEKNPLVEKVVRRFMEAKSEDRDSKLDRLMQKHPVVKKLSQDLARIEAELTKYFSKVASTDPAFKKGYDDYKKGGWKKYT